MFKKFTFAGKKKAASFRDKKASKDVGEEIVEDAATHRPVQRSTSFTDEILRRVTNHDSNSKCNGHANDELPNGKPTDCEIQNLRTEQNEFHSETVETAEFLSDELDALSMANHHSDSSGKTTPISLESFAASNPSSSDRSDQKEIPSTFSPCPPAAEVPSSNAAFKSFDVLMEAEKIFKSLSADITKSLSTIPSSTALPSVIQKYTESRTASKIPDHRNRRNGISPKQGSKKLSSILNSFSMPSVIEKCSEWTTTPDKPSDHRKPWRSISSKQDSKRLSVISSSVSMPSVREKDSKSNTAPNVSPQNPTSNSSKHDSNKVNMPPKFKDYIPTVQEENLEILAAFQLRCLEYREMIRDCAESVLPCCRDFNESSIPKIVTLSDCIKGLRDNFSNFIAMCNTQLRNTNSDEGAFSDIFSNFLQTTLLFTLEEQNNTFLTRLQSGVDLMKAHCKYFRYQSKSKQLVMSLLREIRNFRSTSVGLRV